MSSHGRIARVVRWGLILSLLGISVGKGAQAAPEKRPIPDYDGRQEPGGGAGEMALWVPRVLVSPLYLTSEYVIRRPLGALVVTAERDNWVSAMVDLFTFNEDHTIGLVPTAFFDFGFRPSVGAYFFWDKAGSPQNEVRAQVGTWGESWLSGTIADRYWLSSLKDSSITTRVEATRRPDYIFHGIGSRSLESDRSRYRADKAEASVAFDVALWRQSSIRSVVGARSYEYKSESCCEDPSIQTQVDKGRFSLPPGFENGFSAGFTRLEFAIDTRKELPLQASGIRFEGFGEQALRLDKDYSESWVKYGGSVGGFLDLNGKQRVLSLWVTALMADPWSKGGSIPFTEQVVLGGKGPMRGYREGRLIDRSALIATLHYQWPIWVWLNGSAHVAVGNVFEKHLENFDTKLLRLSSGIGFRTSGTSDHYLELLTGFGTETWEDGLRVTSFRLLLGGNRGF